jgi:hypothetical protein
VRPVVPGNSSSLTGTWTLIVTPPTESTTFLKPLKLTSTKYRILRSYSSPKTDLRALYPRVRSVPGHRSDRRRLFAQNELIFCP